jgi:cobalamin transport system ATP-binding protein
MGAAPRQAASLLVKLNMLEISSLSVAYGKHLVLDQVSLDVMPGQILGVIGPNGAGKSTLVRAASGVIPVQGGRVLVNGEDLSQKSAMQRARLLSVVPQARQLPGTFTVYQTVLLGRTPYLSWLGQPGAQDYQHVRQALEQTQTLELAERRVDELSGGEQQRILLARALAQATPVLLLDEPTTHLDLQHQTSLLNLIKELTIRQNLAVLMVLHDLNLAAMFADRLALLVQGRLSATGAPADVLSSELLADAYHVPVQVIPHPAYGTPLILPHRYTPS